METNPDFPIHLSVSIVLYNSPLELLQLSLRSLYRSAQVAREAGSVSHVSVDIVDNSSDMRCRQRAVEELRGWPEEDFFRVKYVGLPENRGFGAGHNSVISGLDSQYHLVLNPDAVLAEDALHVGLSALADDSGIVLVSPRVSGEDGRQEFLCKRYPSVFALLLRAFAPRIVRRIFRKRLYRYEMHDVCAGDKEADVMLASGCFMLVRTRALRAIGGFNDDYFLYFEDFDLSLRMGSQGRLVFNPAMQIVHHGGYAASKGLRHVKYFIESGVLFFSRHGWRWI